MLEMLPRNCILFKRSINKKVLPQKLIVQIHRIKTKRHILDQRVLFLEGIILIYEWLLLNILLKSEH